jgi:sporulation protein YlmC with PRC-barrel domain
MRMKLVAAGLLCSTLLASTALAQTPAPPASNAQAPTGSVGSGPTGTPFITQQTQGVLRVSDLIGQSVFGANNQDVGEIEDVILDSAGRIAAIVIEMEGGLGLDDREIAVPISSIQVDPVDSTAATGTIGSRGLPASTPEGQQTRAETAMNNIIAPGRVVLTIPVDQLKSAPEFDED